MRKIFTIFVFLIFMSLWGESKKKILVLNSYHLGYPWTKSIIDGLIESTKDENYELYFEFLDTKRFVSDHWSRDLAEYIQNKYLELDIELIITSDDFAYNFAKNHQLMPYLEKPILYCGINEANNVEDHEDSSGIIERIGVKETISLVQQLQTLETVNILVDNTLTGNYIKSTVLREIQSAYPRLSVSVYDELKYDEIPGLVSSFDEKSCVLLLTLFRDVNDEYLPISKSASLVTENSSVPVYSFWDFYKPYGITGGYIIDGYKIGTKLSEMIKVYLEYGSFRYQKKITDLKGDFYINFDKVAKYKLNSRNLPNKVNIVNKPKSIFDLTLKQIIVVVIVFTLNIIAITLLILLHNVKQRNLQIIKKSELFLKRVFNDMPSILIAFDRNFIITNWSDFAEKEIYTKREDAVGFNLFSVLPDLELRKDTMEQAILDSQNVIIERVKLHFKKDRTKLVNIICYPVQMNLFNRYIIRIDDISNQARLEEIMLQTDKMAAISGMAAGVAHEINNPLSGIMQSVQLIESKIDKEIRLDESYMVESLFNKLQIGTLLGYIKLAADQAGIIVRNLVQFSQTRNDSLMTHSINDLVNNTISLAKKDYHFKKVLRFDSIEIITRFSPELPNIACVSSRIEQAFFNVLKNSSESFLECGTNNPIIVITTEMKNNFVQIKFTDNGSGIDKSIISHIFEPFFTTKKDKKSPGLGLSVAFFIISDQHSGTIEAQSINDKTEVLISLPIENKNKI